MWRMLQSCASTVWLRTQYDSWLNLECIYPTIFAEYGLGELDYAKSQSFRNDNCDIKISLFTPSSIQTNSPRWLCVLRKLRCHHVAISNSNASQAIWSRIRRTLCAPLSHGPQPPCSAIFLFTAWGNCIAINMCRMASDRLLVRMQIEFQCSFIVLQFISVRQSQLDLSHQFPQCGKLDQ